MENSPTIQSKGFFYSLLDSIQKILEMQIAGGGLAVVFPSCVTKLGLDQLIFIACVAIIMLLSVVYLKGDFK